MTRREAIAIVLRSPYRLVRVHPWAGWRVTVLRAGLFPQICWAWWTWDALGPVIGQRIAEVVDVTLTGMCSNAEAAAQMDLLRRDEGPSA